MKLYEGTLKVVVALIVLCFFGVGREDDPLAGSPELGEPSSSGFVPDLSVLMHPAATYTPFLEAVGRDLAGVLERQDPGNAAGRDDQRQRHGGGGST